jgi:uncharacterized membrane protein
MGYEVQVFLLLAAAMVALFAALAVMMKEHREAAAAAASQFGVSTEGEKRCPACGMGNLWMDRNCISCGKRLPG